MTAFVQTVLLTAEHPKLCFGHLSREGFGRALAFALLCESLAISSFFLVAAVVSGLILPQVTARILFSPEVLQGSVLVIGGLAVAMVLLHLLWGEFLERGVRSAGLALDRPRGLRFGLYACGWDFLTSPIGLFGATRARGRHFLAPMLAAGRVPRQAMDHYLTDCRQLSPTERKLALRHMTLLFLCSIGLVGLPGLALGLWLGLKAYLSL